jgi:hypothetical protein
MNSPPPIMIGIFTEVDGVFHHFVFVLADKAHLDAERHAEGQAKGATFVGGVARLAQVVADVFKTKIAVVAFDRKDFAKERFEPFVLALVGS